jgi:hypothetical protein
MHWGVLIAPSLLLGHGPLIVIATTLEFISAQSPQSMKGLLVGVFFAIRGLFQLITSTGQGMRECFINMTWKRSTIVT